MRSKENRDSAPCGPGSKERSGCRAVGASARLRAARLTFSRVSLPEGGGWGRLEQRRQRRPDDRDPLTRCPDAYALRVRAWCVNDRGSKPRSHGVLLGGRASAQFRCAVIGGSCRRPAQEGVPTQCGPGGSRVHGGNVPAMELCVASPACATCIGSNQRGVRRRRWVTLFLLLVAAVSGENEAGRERLLP